jgi:tetratricopeptide (TPR) repeat protein
MVTAACILSYPDGNGVGRQGIRYYGPSSVPAMRSLATLSALLLGASLARAGPVDDCNQVRDLKRQLHGCTAYIKQGKAALENLATAYLNRANIYAQRGKYALAFADYGSALALDARNPLIPYNRGNAYLDTGRYELAIADYSRAIELDVRFALAYLNRGIAHEQRGDASAAAEGYRQALAIDPTGAAAQGRLKRLQSQ